MTAQAVMAVILLAATGGLVRMHLQRRIAGLPWMAALLGSNGIAVAASPKLWIVSASNATLPDIITTATWDKAVMARMTKDHLIAQIPRSVVTRVGSTTP